MSQELWGLFIENAAKYAHAVCVSSIGEPTLHPTFQRYVEMIPKYRPYSMVIFTNWSLVTREKMEALKRFDWVLISLDASRKDLWEKLCPGGPVLDLNGAPSQNRYDTLR